MREPTYKCPQYAWFFNDATKTGEIQVQPGVVCEGSVSIALNDANAVAFDAMPPEGRGPALKSHFLDLQRMRAAKGR